MDFTPLLEKDKCTSFGGDTSLTEPALDDVASRPGIGRNRNKTILTHDCS
jgi:hypothetical protein